MGSAAFLTVLAFGSLFLSFQRKLCAEEVLSNLANRWVDPGNPHGNNSIGDIHSAGAPFTVHFFIGGQRVAATNFFPTANQVRPATGSRTNAGCFHLNWVTFEFFGGHVQPWNKIQVDLYQQFQANHELIGRLNIAVIDPRPTQWPESSNPPWFCTTYVDFLPATDICLQPQSDYYVSVTAGGDFALLFGLSSHYTGVSGWRMGPTSTLNPWAMGESIKFSVDAAPNAGSFPGSGGSSNISISATKVGTNLVLRWPASSYELYSTEQVESRAWQPSTDTPFRSNTDLLVSVPFSNVARLFRLKAPDR